MHATRGMRSVNRNFRTDVSRPAVEEVSSPVGARSHTTMADQAMALRRGPMMQMPEQTEIPQELLPQWGDLTPEDRQRLLQEMSMTHRG